MFQILVVEDDASLRKLMSAALKQHGYVTFLANDGLEALDVLEKTNIDLIISDIIVCAGRKALLLVLEGLLCGDHKYRQVEISLSELSCKLVAVHIRHHYI